jgi:YD repeat-containing protein
MARLKLCVFTVIIQLAMAFSAVAQETRYIYDPAGRLIGVVDQEGRITIYEYDAVGNLLAIRRPEATAAVAITFVNPSIGHRGCQWRASASPRSCFMLLASTMLDRSCNICVHREPARVTSHVGSRRSPVPPRIIQSATSQGTSAYLSGHVMTARRLQGWDRRAGDPSQWSASPTSLSRGFSFGSVTEPSDRLVV